jgi:hypothetical protein
MKQSMFENLVKEFEQECSALFEDFAFDNLFEHRGAPDPAKVRERQEAHKRGLERHKNALKRQAQAQASKKRNKQSKAERKTELLDKVKNLKTAGVQKGKQLTVIEKQKAPTVEGQKNVQTKTQAKQQAKDLSTSIKKEHQRADNNIKKMINNAPSTKAKEKAENLKTHIKEYKEELKKLSENNTLTKEQIKDKKEKLESNVKDLEKDLSDNERHWFKNGAKKILGHTLKATDNFFDLCGIKAVYDDVFKAADFLTGGLIGK